MFKYIADSNTLALKTENDDITTFFGLQKMHRCWRYLWFGSSESGADIYPHILRKTRKKANPKIWGWPCKIEASVGYK